MAAIPSDCIARNAGLPDNSRYCSQTIENLISRFEEPNANSRWDSPLIVFPWCDALVSNSSTNREGLAGKLQGLRVIETHESKPVVMPEGTCVTFSQTGPMVSAEYIHPLDVGVAFPNVYAKMLCTLFRS